MNNSKIVCVNCGSVREVDPTQSCKGVVIDSELVELAFLLDSKGYTLDEATVQWGVPAEKYGLGTIKLFFRYHYRFLTFPIGFRHTYEGDFAISVIKNIDQVNQYDKLQKIIRGEIRELYNWARGMPTWEEAQQINNAKKRRNPCEEIKNLFNRIISACQFWRS